MIVMVAVCRELGTSMTSSRSDNMISFTVSFPSMKLSLKLVTGENVISSRVLLLLYLNNGTVAFKL